MFDDENGPNKQKKNGSIEIAEKAEIIFKYNRWLFSACLRSRKKIISKFQIAR